MISLSDIPAAGAVTKTVTGIRQRLSVPLTWVGTGILASPLLLDVAGRAEGRLLVLPSLGNTLLPGWILTLWYVFICIAFISIAVGLRHRLDTARMEARSVIGVAAVMLAVVGASAWIGPGWGVTTFIAGLMLGKSRWGDHPLFRRLAGLRSWSTLLFFIGLGVLAFSPTALDLLWIVISTAGGLIFLRAGVLFFFAGARPSAGIAPALWRGARGLLASRRLHACPTPRLHPSSRRSYLACGRSRTVLT